MHHKTAHLIVIDPRGHLADYHPCWVAEQPTGNLQVDYMREGKPKTDRVARKHIVSLRYYG
jgi:hypothetical protein